MLKIRKYFKPFLTGLMVVIVLLFVQAICDLNLPNYMSDIVNVGIQQNGIDSGAPEAISSQGYNFMKVFMSEDERTFIDTMYEVKSSSDKMSNGKAYSTKFEKADEVEFYGLVDDVSQEDMDKIATIFGGATWTMRGVLTQVANTSQSSQNTEETSSTSTDIDMTQLYELAPVLNQIPSTVFDTAREETLATEESTLSQAAIAVAKSFYIELGASATKIQNAYIIGIGAKMLLIALLGGIATIVVTLLSSKIAAGIARNLRNDVFKKIQSFSNAEYDKFSTASLITRSTNDIMQIQNLLNIAIRMICYAPIMAIGGIIMAIEKSASMGWVIAAACIALIGLIIAVFATVLPKFKALQKLVDRLNLVSRENLNGLMVIRAFGQGDLEKKRFGVANQDLTATNLFVNKVMAVMMPAMMLIMNGVSVLIVWVGSEYVAASTMQVGDMMAFMQYAMQIIMSFLMLAMMFIFIPRASVSATRIAEVLETKSTILDPQTPKNIKDQGLVEFKNVSFKYDGAEEYVLKNINFKAKPGQTTAFIGSTGSGKTTLINMIPRFYDATEGEVLVGGVNVKDVTQNELRKHIGYVPQKSVLMSGTIESNIKYGVQDAPPEQVEKAATIAQAMDFIEQKEEKMETPIAQGGTNVSGGQRQRLSIARALAIDPDVFIFDDSFSALDYKTDATLRKALKECTAHATVLIVAQRVSTIMEADQIFVLDDGAVVGQGTHKELLKSCTQYYEIASSQLSKEELDNE